MFQNGGRHFVKNRKCGFLKVVELLVCACFKVLKYPDDVVFNGSRNVMCCVGIKWEALLNVYEYLASAVVVHRLVLRESSKLVGSQLKVLLD